MSWAVEPVIRIGFAIILLLITLSLALSFLEGPLRAMRPLGVHRFLQRVLRALWWGLVSLTRLLMHRRRPRVRRGHTRAPTAYFRRNPAGAIDDDRPRPVGGRRETHRPVDR